MQVDFNALMNAMLMAKMETKSPQAAKIFAVFERRGISVIEAMSMLIEICAIAEQTEDGK